MRNISLVIIVLILSGFAIQSCNTTTSTPEAKTNSAHFETVVFDDSGDFLGVTLGDTKESALAKMPRDAFRNDERGYLYYEWDLGNNDYAVELFHGEEDYIQSIDGYIWFYDDEDYYDIEEAEKFLADMKLYFTNKYGEPSKVSNEERKSVIWLTTDKEIELRIQRGQVSWYVYPLG